MKQERKSIQLIPRTYFQRSIPKHHLHLPLLPQTVNVTLPTPHHYNRHLHLLFLPLIQMIEVSNIVIIIRKGDGVLDPTGSTKTKTKAKAKPKPKGNTSTSTKTHRTCNITPNILHTSTMVTQFQTAVLCTPLITTLSVIPDAHIRPQMKLVPSHQ